MDRHLNADVHSAQDLPQNEDFATVSTASEASFSQASRWLRDCLANHRLCSQTPDADFAPPTRVIDIGICGRKLLPRLYLSSSEDVNMKYVALSHCWGETNTAILKNHMLRAMTRGIEWSQLPKTFQDAIYVTRRLGFRYLWIDSLCIIQDSPEDWSRESGTMHDVYANCVLTIAASWGKDSSTGLFIERKPLNQQPCRIFKDGCTGIYIQPNITDPARFSLDENVETLEKRAWAVQERFLPARILSYRSFELRWDCIESHGSESWPTKLRGRVEKMKAEDIGRHWMYDPENTALRQISLLKTRSGRFDLDYMIDFYSHWNDILQTYTGAQLTFRSDVLVAFSGITKNVEKWTGLTNIFGMWKELLPLDLLWECLGQGSKVIRYPLCPTWSWASWVNMGVHRVMCSPELYYRGPGDPVHVKARVICLDPPSAVSGSHMKIEIQGPMFCTKMLWSTTLPRRHRLEGIERSGCSIDSPDEYLSNENVSCLLIMELKDPKPARVKKLDSTFSRPEEYYNRVGARTKVGLILSRREREKEEYVRIGVWSQRVEIFDTTEWEEKHPILNMKEKTISLI